MRKDQSKANSYNTMKSAAAASSAFQRRLSADVDLSFGIKSHRQNNKALKRSLISYNRKDNSSDCNREKGSYRSMSKEEFERKKLRSVIYSNLHLNSANNSHSDINSRGNQYLERNILGDLENYRFDEEKDFSDRQIIPERGALGLTKDVESHLKKVQDMHVLQRNKISPPLCNHSLQEQEKEEKTDIKSKIFLDNKAQREALLQRKMHTDWLLKNEGRLENLKHVQELCKESPTCPQENENCKEKWKFHDTLNEGNQQWKKIEDQFIVSKTEKGTSTSIESCTICQEVFTMNVAEVILCCSHIFHHRCLASFEKFVGRSDKRTCPICRKENYDAKLTTVGGNLARRNGAIIIQSFVRGFLARKRFHILLKAYYNSGRGDQRLRTQFYLSELSKMGNQIIKQAPGSVQYHMNNNPEDSEDYLNDLLHESDNALEISRSVFENHNLMSRYPQNSNRSSHSSRGEEGKQRLKNEEMPMTEWLKIVELWKAREDEECSICMCNLEKELEQDLSAFPPHSATAINTKRYSDFSECVITSCSHTFHRKCLEAFENFNIYEIQLCPVCRSSYSSMPIETIIKEANGTTYGEGNFAGLRE